MSSRLPNFVFSGFEMKDTDFWAVLLCYFSFDFAFADLVRKLLPFDFLFSFVISYGALLGDSGC